eukprot:507719-Rhodomonas_salina.2
MISCCCFCTLITLRKLSFFPEEVRSITADSVRSGVATSSAADDPGTGMRLSKAEESKPPADEKPSASVDAALSLSRVESVRTESVRMFAVNTAALPPASWDGARTSGSVPVEVCPSPSSSLISSKSMGASLLTASL